MDLEITILNKVRKRKTIPYYITRVWNLKYDTNELMYQTETDRHRGQTCNQKRGLGQCKIGNLGLIDANYYL